MKFDYKIGNKESTETIVSLELAKANSHIDDSYEDELLELKLRGAIAAAENYTERIFQKSKIEIKVSEWGLKMVMPVSPISNISKVSYQDVKGKTQELEAEQYKMFSYNNPSRQILLIKLNEFPRLEVGNEFAINIKATIGEETVPDDVKAAILMMFSSQETYREDKPEALINSASRNLLRAYRKF